MQKLDLSGEKPIFLQISENLEDAILSGALPEGEQLPSITELSVQYTINPATALKGINLLVDQGVAGCFNRAGPKKRAGWAFLGHRCPG